jgi:hypothetical protein
MCLKLLKELIAVSLGIIQDRKYKIQMIQNVKAVGMYSYHLALKAKGLEKFFSSLPCTRMIARGMFFTS